VTVRKILQGFLSAILIVALVSLQTLASDYSTKTLSPGAREAANLLGILQKVERLIQLQQSRAGQDSTTLSDEELGLKVDVLDKVMGASLELRMITGRINREANWSLGGQQTLEARRQRNLNYLFAANFLQGGVLGIIAGPLNMHGLSATNTEFAIISSSVSLALSSLSLLESRSGTKKIDGNTNALADVFHLEYPEPVHKADIVTKYLNSVPPQSTDGKTRIAVLQEGWKKGHYLRSTSEEHLQKLASLVPPGKNYRENIGLIGQRIRMLYDTQTEIQQLDGDLLEILRAVDIN